MRPNLGVDSGGMSSDYREPTFVERIAAAWYAASEFCDGRVLFTAPDAEESAAWAERGKRYEAQGDLVFDLSRKDDESWTAISA